MISYILMVIALFSSILFFIALFVDVINSKNVYVKNEADEKNEIIKARYKIILAFIMSLTWGFFLI